MLRFVQLTVHKAFFVSPLHSTISRYHGPDIVGDLGVGIVGADSVGKVWERVGVRYAWLGPC